MTTQNDHNEAQALSNQVDTYSEFLNELARQRHTIIKTHLNTSTTFSSYSVVKARDTELLDKLDQLIRDTLSHIEVTTTASPDPGATTEAVENVKNKEQPNEV